MQIYLYLSVYLSISICLSIYLSIYLSINQSINHVACDRSANFGDVVWCKLSLSPLQLYDLLADGHISLKHVGEKINWLLAIFICVVWVLIIEGMLVYLEHG